MLSRLFVRSASQVPKLYRNIGTVTTIPSTLPTPLLAPANSISSTTLPTSLTLPTSPLPLKALTTQLTPYIKGFKTQKDKFGGYKFEAKYLTQFGNQQIADLKNILSDKSLVTNAIYLSFPYRLLDGMKPSTLMNLGFEPYYTFDKKDVPDFSYVDSNGLTRCQSFDYDADTNYEPHTVWYKWTGNSKNMVPPMGTEIGGAKLMLFSSDYKHMLLIQESRVGPDGSKTLAYNIMGGAKERFESHIETLEREVGEEIYVNLKAYKPQYFLVGGYSKGYARHGGFNDNFMIFSCCVNESKDNIVVEPDRKEALKVLWVETSKIIQYYNTVHGNNSNVNKQDLDNKITDIGLPPNFSLYKNNLEMINSIIQAHNSGTNYGLKCIVNRDDKSVYYN